MRKFITPVFQAELNGKVNDQRTERKKELLWITVCLTALSCQTTCRMDSNRHVFALVFTELQSIGNVNFSFLIAVSTLLFKYRYSLSQHVQEIGTQDLA